MLLNRQEKIKLKKHPTARSASVLCTFERLKCMLEKVLLRTAPDINYPNNAGSPKQNVSAVIMQLNPVANGLVPRC